MSTPGLLFALTLLPMVRLCTGSCAGLARALLLAPEDPAVRVRTAAPARPVSTEPCTTV